MIGLPCPWSANLMTTMAQWLAFLGVPNQWLPRQCLHSLEWQSNNDWLYPQSNAPFLKEQSNTNQSNPNQKDTTQNKSRPQNTKSPSRKARTHTLKKPTKTCWWTFKASDSTSLTSSLVPFNHIHSCFDSWLLPLIDPAGTSPDNALTNQDPRLPHPAWLCP